MDMESGTPQDRRAGARVASSHREGGTRGQVTSPHQEGSEHGQVTSPNQGGRHEQVTSPHQEGGRRGQEADEWSLLDGDYINYQIENGSARYKLDVEDHVQTLLCNICKLWSREQLIDVRIVSEDRKVSHYHGVLLAASSTVFRQILGSEQGQVYQGMLAPRDVASEVLDNLTNCLYRPNLFNESMGSQSSTIEFAVYFGLQELIVNSVINKATLLKNLHEMLQRRCMTYIKLKVEQRLIPCHSLVLAVASPILRNEILADDASLPYNELELVDHSTRALDELLKFIYTAELELNQENMEEILKSSCKLRIMSAAKATCHFMFESVTPDTAMGRRNIARNAVGIHSDTCCVELVQKLEQYIVYCFSAVMVTKEFQEMATYDDALKYIVKANLKEVRKLDILEAMMQWYEYDKEGRLERLPQLLTVINIIKDQQGLHEVLTKALAESKSEIFGLLATVIALKPNIDANTQEQGAVNIGGSQNAEEGSQASAARVQQNPAGVANQQPRVPTSRA